MLSETYGLGKRSQTSSFKLHAPDDDMESFFRVLLNATYLLMTSTTVLTTEKLGTGDLTTRMAEVVAEHALARV